jgi:hypothetical protein
MRKLYLCIPQQQPELHGGEWQRLVAVVPEDEVGVGAEGGLQGFGDFGQLVHFQLGGRVAAEVQ